MTPPDTRTPLLLTTIYEQIENKTVTYNTFIWCQSPSSEPKQLPTPTFTGVGATSLHQELQYREQELDLERQHLLRTQRIYSAFADHQNSLRRQPELSPTRERKLKVDLRAAQRERKKLKDLIPILEASSVFLHADLASTANATRKAAITFDQQLSLVAEKDHVNKRLFAVRARLKDAEDKIARLDAELDHERKLRIHSTEELDGQTKTRRLRKANMRRIAKKTEDVQRQLDLLDDVLSQSRARRRSPLNNTGTHTPHHTNYAIAIAPDDTGQPPPPLQPISDVRTPHLYSVTKPRPFSPKSVRQTPERNPHDPTTRHSPGPPHRVPACLGQVSDPASPSRAVVECSLEPNSLLDAESVREAKNCEQSEWCLQETLQDTNTHAEDVTHGLETCKSRDVQDTRHAGIDRFCNVVELFRQRSADFKSLRADAEASKSRQSEAVYLSAMLRKRAKIIEAEVKSLNPNQKCRAVQTNSPLVYAAVKGLCKFRDFSGLLCRCVG